ncbi:6-bladed beta-propeller [Granulicella sp. WH15]|uniref:peptidyl-alpha-hydroxyglycine alpha-amidating lyase family protein n=1 Tax=Granulicella sp. WH15 TaxID=2602070 RepID=UPI001366AA50|nr:peptidyl-alpha-hydroxyglycine alpha-amidating lyase family protein [Granulicella sp. WH15]QHN03277.1 6-bladed beta-propeller [Granulicella sp. WH15]
MKGLRCFILVMVCCGVALAQTSAGKGPAFEPVPELPYRATANFFQTPLSVVAGEVSAVSLNSKGHIFVFQRGKPDLLEYDEAGKYLRSIGEGLFTVPHGLRFDADDNIWVTDTGSHIVLKLDHDGRVLMVLGRKNVGAEGDWLFNKPADVAFGKNGEFFVADGYGNSRIMKFDRNGKFLKQWGSFGEQPGQFQLPHSIVIDKQWRIYVADREGGRIQIFDYDGKFLKEWDGIGYPYGLFITPDQHIWMSDGGLDRVVEFDPEGRIVGAVGEPGHGLGQFVWPHFLAVGPDRKIYVADVLNWRVDVFVPTGTAPTGKMSPYVPTKRVFNEQIKSSGWSIRHP